MTVIVQSSDSGSMAILNEVSYSVEKDYVDDWKVVMAKMLRLSLQRVSMKHKYQCERLK